MATLTHQELSYFKSELKTLEKEVVQRYNHLETGQDEDINSVDNHMGDAGTALFDKEKEFSLRDSDAELLNEINLALQRIEQGTYGVCVDTGEPISKERLKAIPYAKRTIQAQKKYNLNSNEPTESKKTKHEDPSETIEQLKEEQDAFEN